MTTRSLQNRGPPSFDYTRLKMMLNVLINAMEPLTLWLKLDIIHLVSIRSLAPGMT